MSKTESPDGLLYIGPNDCQKVTCNRRQEFPNGDDPYCIGHSFAAWSADTDDPKQNSR